MRLSKDPRPFPRSSKTRAALPPRSAPGRARARDRDDAAALSALGVLLSEEKLFAESRDLLRRAARVDRSRPAPERKRTRRALARAETEAGQRDEAVRLLKEAIAITPADPGEDAAAEQVLGALPSR